MPAYKLVYFNIRGRAEVARLMFAQAEVDYEDKRVSEEEWVLLKPTTPTGQLPLLEVDGKTLSGSRPINRFLAEKFGLAGKNDLENAEIAGIIDFLEDFSLKLLPYYFEEDESKKEEAYKTIAEKEIPIFFGYLEKRASANSGNWIYGENLTYADIAIFNGLDFLPTMFPNILDGRPALKKLYEAVRNLPHISQWLKKRPQTEY